MMMRRLIIRPEAQRDIEEAAFWYEIQQPRLGDRFTDELDHLLEQMTVSPLQFPEVGRGVRRGFLQRFPYAVYFVMEKETITVIAILHQHRHPDTWKQRL